MYNHRYIQYLNLPAIPNEILAKIPTDSADYTDFSKIVIPNGKNKDRYRWTDVNNQELNQWCNENICADMYYAFQFMIGNSRLHKDIGTLTKINYVLDTGGDDVLTEFFADDQVTKLASYKIEPKRWHIFKADTYHQVINVKPGKTRFAVTARIFGE